MLKWITVMIFLLGQTSLAGTEESLNKIVYEWSRAVTNKALGKLDKMYASQIMYYGHTHSRHECLMDKKRFYHKYPTFSQSIDHLVIESHGGGLYTVLFNKYVHMSRHASRKLFPGYLTIDLKKSEEWIVEEGDKITNSILEKRKQRDNF